jgi:hypothetical protein
MVIVNPRSRCSVIARLHRLRPDWRGIRSVEHVARARQSCRSRLTEAYTVRSMRLLAPLHDTVVRQPPPEASEVHHDVPDETGTKSASADDAAVIAALRAQLARRGHLLSGDTTGMHKALYIMGHNDRAAALFEFKPSADDAVYELMYQGAWVAGMPPRFVVLPGDRADRDSLETLEQMKATPLLFDVSEGLVTFRDLDRRLEYLDAR